MASARAFCVAWAENRPVPQVGRIAEAESERARRGGEPGSGLPDSLPAFGRRVPYLGFYEDGNRCRSGSMNDRDVNRFGWGPPFGSCLNALIVVEQEREICVEGFFAEMCHFYTSQLPHQVLSASIVCTAASRNKFPRTPPAKATAPTTDTNLQKPNARPSGPA